jgi:hypothetical protein
LVSTSFWEGVLRVFSRDSIPRSSHGADGVAEQAILVGNMVRTGARQAVAAVRRQLWVAVLVTVLVIVLAVVRYGGAAALRPQYMATQALVVQLLPPSGGGAYTAASAGQLADQLSRHLAGGALLAMPVFDRAVAAQIDKDRDQVGARFGAAAVIALTAVDPRTVEGALTAAQASDEVIITARWQTPAGAWALATAAGEVLTADPGLALGALPASADGASVRVVRRGAATAPALDPTLESAARARLLETILLGLVGGLALAYSVDRWPVWRRALAERHL